MKRVLVLILAECMKIQLEPPRIGPARDGGNAALLNMLKDAVEQLSHLTICSRRAEVGA